MPPTCATCRRSSPLAPISVYAGEGEVGIAFVEDLLGSLGATPEQIDRERARAREELAALRV